MPRLGRTALLKRDYRRTVRRGERPETPAEAEERRRAEARAAARGYV